MGDEQFWPKGPILDDCGSSSSLLCGFHLWTNGARELWGDRVRTTEGLDSGASVGVVYDSLHVTSAHWVFSCWWWFLFGPSPFIYSVVFVHIYFTVVSPTLFLRQDGLLGMS